MSADYKTLVGLLREFVEEIDKCRAIWDDANKDLVDRVRAAIVPGPPKPTNDAKILHVTAEDDPCCSKHFQSDGRKGRLDHATIWTCPKCGCNWTRSGEASPYVWQARPDMFLVIPR